MSTPANTNRPWIDQDDSDLLDFAEHGTIEEAAAHLGRSIEECEARLRALHS